MKNDAYCQECDGPLTLEMTPNEFSGKCTSTHCKKYDIKIIFEPEPPTEMDNWIKELEENAENFNHYKKGDLYLDDPIVTYFYKSELKNKKDIFLSGSFSIAELQSLITHIKKHNKEG